MTDAPTPAPVPDGTAGARPASRPRSACPATRPASEPLPAERFTAAPPIRATAGLTPAARRPGSSASRRRARWVGFLTVIFVSLFIVGYWFYELGAPAGLRRRASTAEIDAQQVTAVERGYNLFEANCARCHGPNGLGPTSRTRRPRRGRPGLHRPQLNAQEKLFAHLNEAVPPQRPDRRRPLRLRQRQLG